MAHLTCVLLWVDVYVIAAVDPLSALANYGALGVIVAAFILGLVHSKTTVDRLVVERDRAEQRAEGMLTDYKAVVPVLERAIEAIRQADTQATDNAAVTAQLKAALEANTAALQRVSGYMERR